MQARFKLHAKALLFSLTAVGCGFLVTFFFYDGSPPQTPHLLAAAEATETDNSMLAQASAAELPAVSGPSLELPPGFQANWKTIQLDGQIPLQVLSHRFTLRQTRHQAGSEYYDYSAYLFDQLAAQVSDKALSHRLQTLSLQAQTMGNAVRQAAELRYDGPPSQDMTHLQVRSSIQFYLSGLNPNALTTVQYDQHGKMLKTEQAVYKPNQNGSDLQAFLKTTGEVLQDPAARRYPEALQLVQRESKLLENLSEHLSLRWESTLYCHKTCTGMATSIRVYTRQTLPQKQIEATI